MTTTPDPKTVPDPQLVQELATELMLDAARDIDYMGIGERYFDDERCAGLDEDQQTALQDAISEFISEATVVVTAPGEQLQDKPYPCGCPTVGDICDCGPDPCGCSPDPGCAFCDSPNDPPRPQDERDARIAELEREPRELRGTELNPSPMVLDAQAYGELRDEIAATMGDGWDLDEAEISILIKYVRWLAAGQPRDEDGYPIRRETYPPAAVQAERDGGNAQDLYFPFTGALDTCYGEHDDDSDGYRECCMRAGLAYALKLHERQVRAKTATERDGDVRAVDNAIKAITLFWSGEAPIETLAEARAQLIEHYGSQIATLDAAVLEARDAKGGEQR